MKALLLLQVRLELRKRAVAVSLLLYLLCLVFINYFTLGIQHAIETPGIWSALFWIAILSTVVSAITKSFSVEKSGAGIYLYSIANPASIIVSKMIYGFALCFIISLLGFVAFATILNNPVQDFTMFLVALILASYGFSASLSVLSAIASKTNNSSVVMAILSFPLLIGILAMAIKITKNCIDGLEWIASSDEILTLIAINLLMTAVSYLLFPYIWRS